MTALAFTAKNISIDTGKGSVVRPFPVATAIATPLGKVVYVDSNGAVELADADVTVAESRAVGVIVAVPNTYGENSIAAGENCSVCVFGPVFGFSALAEGTYAWVSKTAGELDDTAPTSGAFQYIVGYCEDTDTFFVNPGIAARASV